MSKFTEIKPNNFYFGSCKLHSNQKKLAYHNPHCAEYFCTMGNIYNCNECTGYLKQKHVLTSSKTKSNVGQTVEKTEAECKLQCTNGLVYDFVGESWNINNSGKSQIDQHKSMSNFYQDKLIYHYDEIPVTMDFEPAQPKPKSVVHWGQLKMFLVTLLFLTNRINPDDKEVHIIYPGSARGDNILILCDMFPNTYWYLIDPLPFHPKLSSHKQIKEISKEYFTDETAKYYGEKFAKRTHPLFLLSDIRVNTDDKSVMENQESNAKWHQMINPDYSYFKFRCPYDGPDTYNYYTGKIYIQPYAPVSSSEARIQFAGKLEKTQYSCSKYIGQFNYFNRVLRPSLYTQKIIPNQMYFDKCYDCTYFSHLIKTYTSKFAKSNPWSKKEIIEIMREITQTISKLTLDRIEYQNKLIRKNIF